MIIRPKSSICFFTVITLMHVGALMLLFFIAWPVVLLCALAIIIISHFGYVISRYILLKTPWSIRELKLRPNNEVIIWFNNSSSPHIAVLQSSYFMNQFLIILYVKLTNSFFPMAVILFKDSESENNLRRLRAWLGMHRR